MHAVVAVVTVNDETTGTARLRDEIVPRVSSAPGFVAGYWVRLPGGKGASIVAFESEGAAQTMVDTIRDRPTADDAVTFDSIEIGEVVASA
jgi:hypothetical protein